MITTNFQKYGSNGFHLRLRLSQGSEVRYINVNKLLHGDLKPEHWDNKAKLFKPSAPFAEDNNRLLVDMKSKYDNALMEYTGSLFSFTLNVKQEIHSGEPIHRERTLSDVMEWCVENAKQSKHDDGTLSGTFETYLKIIRRLKDYCSVRGVKYENIKIAEVDEALVNDFLDFVEGAKKGKAQYVSCMFKAALNKADKQGWFDFKKVERCKWRKRIRSSKKKYETLTSQQCKQFADMSLDLLPESPRRRLFRDFCVFILYTCQSACDAISLRYSDIKNINGVDHFVFKRRKIENKQSIDCTVPINPVMREIMDYWKPHTKDGYIFPIRTKQTIREATTNNIDIKVFVKCCNKWLKGVGKLLKCDFDLHTYVFRHTAITHYISKGVPVVYVANLAGTSVENCQNIYYNNQGDTTSRDKVLAAMSF